MKYPYYIFILGALIVGNCKAQEIQIIPAIIEIDDYNYQVANTPVSFDSTNIMFDLYYSTDSLGIYTVLANYQVFTYNLLNHIELYNDSTYYFYLRARVISTGATSGRSVIVSSVLPVILPNVPMEATIITIPIGG